VGLAAIDALDLLVDPEVLRDLLGLARERRRAAGAEIVELLAEAVLLLPGDPEQPLALDLQALVRRHLLERGLE
jgi:hypothetical protein